MSGEKFKVGDLVWCRKLWEDEIGLVLNVHTSMESDDPTPCSSYSILFTDGWRASALPHTLKSLEDD